MTGDGERDLEDLFASYVDRLNDAEELDEERILAENPIFGAEILDRLRDYVGAASVDAGKDEDEPLGTLGDFTLRRQIGRGGMGVVYEAWQGSMDRRVALKVLPAGIAADDRAFQRFMQEARAAGKLSHSSIVAVHAMGQDAHTPYYAMDFVDGETLAQVVARLKVLEPEAETVFGPRESVIFFGKLAAAFADVADGLQHAHARKVIHRDIKPSNLIVDKEGRLRILDFGLARLEGQESLTASGDLVGTPQYMSPEQARRRQVPIDHRTDIYSLGATLYELLTSRPPFRGKDHAETLSQIIERDPVEPKKINSRVPKDLETIVLKCLRKDAGDRYGTAEALGQDLRRVLRGEMIEARAQGAWERLARRLHRHKNGVVAAAFALFAVIVGLAVTTVLVANAYRFAEDHRAHTQRQLYISDMRQAVADWEAGNLARFQELLDRHRPQGEERDLRGWEWHHLDSRRQTSHAPLETDSDAAAAVAWSPDGQAVACGASDGVIRIFDASQRTQRFQLSCPVGPARAVAWSLTGDRIAAVCQDGTLSVWDLNGQPVYSHEAKINSPQFFAVAFHPDGTLLASASADQAVRIRSSADGALLHSIELREFLSIPGLSFNSKGDRMAVAGLSPASVVVFDTAAWKEIHRFTPPAWLYAAVWSPDDALLATASEDIVKVWDAGTGAELRSFRAHSGYVLSVDWSPDSRQVVSGGQDGLVKVWDLDARDKSPTVLRGHTGVIWSVSWDRISKRIASASQDGTLRIWDPSIPTEFVGIPGSAPATWDHEGKKLAVTSVDRGEIQVLDVQSGQLLRSFKTDHKVSVLALSPDDSLLAGVMNNGMLSIWEWQERAVVHTIDGEHAGEHWCVSWAPDSKQFATGGDDGMVRIWDAKALAPIDELRGHMDHVGAVAWSPKGSLIAATDFALSLKIWTHGPSGWSLLHDLRRGSRQWNGSREATRPWALAWSPDGMRIAAVVASGVPQGLTVWDATGGKEIFRAQGHSSGVTSVAWSPDGRRLATGGVDRTVIIWDAEAGNELIRVGGHEAGIMLLKWDPSGRRLLSGDKQGVLKMWEALGYK